MGKTSGNGSGKGVNPTAPAARLTAQQSPPGRPLAGPRTAATPRRWRIKAIASGSRRSTTTGQGQAGLSSSLPPNSVEIRSITFTADTADLQVWRRIPPREAYIGQFRARHSNSGGSLTYTLTGRDASFFTIDNDGRLRTSSRPLDYETQPGQGSHYVEITAD